MAAIKTLQELATAKAIKERSWLKNDFIFGTFPRDLKYMFIQCCMEAKNITAFEEFILEWKQQDLIIRDNADFNSEFSLVVYNLISNKNSHWKDTGINNIDFSGCDIGAAATNKFCNLIRKQEKNPSEKEKTTTGCFPDFSVLWDQNWHSHYETPTSIILSLHIRRDNYDNVFDTLSKFDSLRPYGIKSDALGSKNIVELLNLLRDKRLPLYELDAYMNSLMSEGVIEISRLLIHFTSLRKLNLGYAMISEDDRAAIRELNTCLSKFDNLEFLDLTACLLESGFISLFESMHVRNLKHLRLASCGLPKQAIECLAEVLQKSEIRVLELKYNSLKSDESFRSFVKLLKNCKDTLVKLDISNTGLKHDQIEELVRFLLLERNEIALRELHITLNDELLVSAIKDAIPGLLLVTA